MKRACFTLIELLVVISIIAVLLAILLPAMASARATGQSTKCLAALHDVGLALQAYLQTNDDRFPLSQAHGGYQPGTAWLDTLAPHTESKLQYRCPSDEAVNFDAADATMRRVTSYGVNIFMGPNSDDWFPNNPSGIPPFGYEIPTRLGAKASTLIYSAELAEVDRNGVPIYPDHFHAERWGTNPFCGTGGADPQYDLAIKRHRGQASYLYADAHAERAKFNVTWRASADGAVLEINQYDPGFPHSPSGWYQPGE
jgi:prepilin-type N-terminal cleavage/methylation domain-containing protein/prepilin-type processing-associated H-X9-DG protein